MRFRSSSLVQSSQCHHNTWLDLCIASPPVVFFNTAELSAEIPFFGEAIINIQSKDTIVESFNAKLVLRVVHMQHPSNGLCHNCRNVLNDIHSWEFLSQAKELCVGQHGFTFEAQLPGNLPPSVATPGISITYTLTATAAVRHIGSRSASRVHFERDVLVKRTIPQPEYPHQSIRLFPPTELLVRATYNSVIYPRTVPSLSIKITGVLKHHKKFKMVDIWILRSIAWELQEFVRIPIGSCKQPQNFPAPTRRIHEKDKGLETTKQDNIRIQLLRSGLLLEGWKSDYSILDSNVEAEFDISPDFHKSLAGTSASSDRTGAKDLKAWDGTEIWHKVRLELTLTKEYAPEDKPDRCTSTDTGRKLQMEFPVVMADDPDSMIDWETEAPPMYGAVPVSPPSYTAGDKEAMLNTKYVTCSIHGDLDGLVNAEYNDEIVD
ncbi:hypothetical protein NQ176_g1978 [Zarea fungicola]|uniref:Uncharacterized protein n=1 Tax=Zarea fungicola TaxID=93591 RepID=A0ACC1NQF7_9HYPO|nr:hypothetical protein NQ176_g1978 [Lecanicillium fungicola]